MEDAVSKIDLINKWKDAFKSEAFLENHRIISSEEMDTHRSIQIKDNIWLTIGTDTRVYFIGIVTGLHVMKTHDISSEEFQELFDLYESNKKINN